MQVYRLVWIPTRSVGRVSVGHLGAVLGHLVRILALLLLGIGAGCNGVEGDKPQLSQGNTQTDESQLSARAQARWDALIKGDFETAYGFTTPAYRQAFSLAHFRGGFGSGVQWKEARVLKADVAGDVAEVTVEVSYAVPVPAAKVTYEDKQAVQEKWIKEDEMWWHFSR